MKFPRQPVEEVNVNLTPLIDVVFLLLIFFMLTSTTTLQSKKVELPTAKTAEKNSKQFLTVTIDKNGSLELDGKAIAIEALPVHLEKKVAEKKNAVISIHADKAIKFELFGKVIELAKQAGAADFMLATENDKSDKGSL